MDEPSKDAVAIVGIGASAGGIEAFKYFFENMPDDSGMAFVVILHLPLDRKSLLPDILSRWTSMRVVEAQDACLVEANCVYVPPAGAVVTLAGGRLRTHRPAEGELREPTPIDMFFSSMASELKEKAVGVVLSGTGSDGALGLKAIQSQGGLTLAQGADGTSPQHTGMPTSAIATGAVEIVASVEDMPKHILAASRSGAAENGAVTLSVDQINDARLAICTMLHRQLGHDFSGYKEKTFLRRIQRRMQVCGLDTLPQYVAYLEGERAETVMLFHDLLIGVTSFFRDPETFIAIEHSVLPRLFANRTSADTIRVWVPACATGEEAYSMAMLLREYAEGLGDAAPAIQVFATDIDEPAIAIARMGRYPAALLQALSAERRSRFFVEGNDGTFTITKEVREICTFSAHSLVRDPPFSRIDMVSCRNLLIYLDNDLQGVVIPAFHYSLVRNGVLLLGSSETISRHENLFGAIDKLHRIFERRDTPSPPLNLTGRASARDAVLPKSSTLRRIDAARAGMARMNSRASARVLERFAPAFVVVSAEGDVQHFSNRIGRFLEPAPGLPSQNAIVMARHGLRSSLRTALRQAVETGRPVEKANVRVAIPGEGTRQISLAIEPLHEPNVIMTYLVVFVEDADRSATMRTQLTDDVPFEAITDRHLETELRDTREQLQSVTEEHETALEELRSANEELHSVNEELQSTNEELETSKEEIQSVNEELQTVNSQLACKVDELDHRNSDLKNLFDSTQVATIFLDPYLVVRGFTPAVASIYNLIPSDEGRPLTDISSRIRYASLRDDVRNVLSTLEPLERRVARDDNTTHYLMRILPYRTPDSSVDGTLITFVDVSSIVQAEQHQRLLVDELNHRVKNMLTVVIAMATQTLRRSQTLEQFSETYLARVHALSAAYSLLSKQAWQSVSLRSIVEEELKPFQAQERSNIVLNGPEVMLEPRAALALGLAVHELTTNAVKYGALSVPEGNIDVQWSIEDEAKDDYFSLKWVERDGPSVRPPERRGFGLAMIERGLKQDMSAEVKVHFEPGGIEAFIRAPMTMEAEIADADGPQIPNS